MRINFLYKNHKGIVSDRQVDMDSLEYIREPGYGYEAGWFVSGFDRSRGARRSFALTNIQLPDEKVYKLMRIHQ